MTKYLLAAIITLVGVPLVELQGADAVPGTNGALSGSTTANRDQASSNRKYPPPPPAVVDITVPTLYEKGTGGSVVDHKAKKERQEELGPIRDFSDTVSQMADWFVGDGDEKAAQCGLAWLRAWADKDAVLGKLKTLGNQGGDAAGNSQMRFLGDVALAYLKLQSVATAKDQEAINSWMRKLAARVQQYEREAGKVHNNNYFKSGVALMATGIAIKDWDSLAEGRKIFDAGLSQIEDDGTLPQEMKRQIKALIYHDAAACALVMMAELARSQGQDWYGARNHRLELLVNRVVKGLKDPSFFNAKSGHKQLDVPPKHIGWLIYWEKQCNNPNEIAAVLKSIGGSYSESQYAGDATKMVEKHFFDPRR